MIVKKHNHLTISMALLSSLLLSSLLLSGCFGSPTPIPEDHFYTLKISAADTIKTKYKRINIKRVQAYGLYNERAMLYTHAELPLQINRYHYHHWVKPPTHLIQHGLKDYLTQSHIAEDIVVQAISEKDDLSVSVELIAFERVLAQGSQSVHVELEFEVLKPNGKYHSYKYNKNINTKRDTLHAAANSYGEVLSIIYKEFVDEL